MMIWMAKQLISTGFCTQIIKGQKLSKTTIVGAESSDYLQKPFGMPQCNVVPLV